MSEQLLIVDTSSIRQLAEAGSDALDLLFGGGKRVVITDSVYREMNRFDDNAPLKIKFLDWLARNFDPDSLADSKIIRIDVGLPVTANAGEASIQKLMREANIEGLIKDQFADYIGDNADVSFRLLIDELPAYNFEKSQSGQFQPDRLAANGQYAAPYRGVGHFLQEALANNEIDLTTHNRVANAIRSGSFWPNNYSDFFKYAYLSEAEAASFSPETARKLFGDNFGRIIIPASVLGVSLAALRQFGILGDVLGFGVTAAHAADLRTQGKNEDADRVWVRYIFETSGGVVGGVLGAAIGLSVGGPLGALVGGIVLGYGAGEYGADFGDFLYTNYREVVQPGLDQMNQLIDAALSDDEDVSRRFAEAVIQGLGFDISTVQGSAGVTVTLRN